MSTAHAEASLAVKIFKGDDHVLYCDIIAKHDTRPLRKSLQEGINMSFLWTLRIEEVNQYWWNHEFATVHIHHKVIPDLLSGNWALVDQSSGINQHVSNIDDAIAFLISFKQLPFLDQSLLDQNKKYLLQIELHSSAGASDQEIDSWFYTPHEIAATTLSLP
ncbi:MAG: DUF4390 domain-containing protein [Mariprofundaceae bacterium]|nr:DUF4390 domain-containing protein [Mariprofundaceae bacterium]